MEFQRSAKNPRSPRRRPADGLGWLLPVWASPPSFDDAEKTHSALTLFVLSLGLMAMGTFSMVLEWGHGWIGAASTLGVENLCLMAALWFNRRGEIDWATKIICFSELGCAVLLITRFGIGLKDEELLLFPLMLVTAALLLDWRPYLIFAGLVILTLAGAGFFLAETGARKFHVVVNSVNILLTTMAAAGLLARDLRRSVTQARESERELKALSARRIDAQEEERARLSRELHDDLAQQIAALSIGMSNLKKKLPQKDEEARGQSERIQQKLVDLSESIRRLSHELHPAVLEHAGLAAALRDYCSEYGRSTGIRVSVQTTGSLEGVPAPVALCIYRITQEALQNVAKHAHVGEAEVELRRSGGLLCLTVSDRGSGVEASRGARPMGLGLVNIKERARLVNGTFELQSKRGHGTAVVVRIPA